MGETEKTEEAQEKTRKKIIKYIQKQIGKGETTVYLDKFHTVLMSDVARDKLQTDILKAGIPFNGWGFLTPIGWYLNL